MKGFYFDVGGVIIPDHLGRGDLQTTIGVLTGSDGVASTHATSKYLALQPSFDLGSISLRELCEALGVLESDFTAEWLRLHEPFQHVVQLIRGLIEDGFRVGLATNFCRSLLNALLAQHALPRDLIICCSADIGIAKPNPAFFAAASELMHTDEILYFDDRIENVTAARVYGWTASLVTDPSLLTRAAICGRPI